MKQWNELASEESLEKVAAALQANGFEVKVAENGAEAKEKAMALIPKGAEIMNMTSMTLETTGLVKEINESGNYDAVRPKLLKMDRKTEGREMQKMGAAPDWSMGSVHAVTEDGKVLIASASGSQIPAHAYGAGHVIFVVGAQKVVKDITEGMRRIYEYSLPLESERAKKAYGVPGSSVN